MNAQSWLKINRERVENEMAVYRYLHIKKEPVVCSVFGCGITLTIEQELYGGKCPKHSNSDNSNILLTAKIKQSTSKFHNEKTRTKRGK